MLLLVTKIAGSSSGWLDLTATTLLTLELIIEGGGPCLTSTLLLTTFVTDFTPSFFLFLELLGCLFAFGADCLGALLSTIFEGPVTTSTFVMICFCSFAADLGALPADLGTFGFSFFGGEDTTDTALDRTAGAAGLLVLSLSAILLGLMASGLMLVTDGGGGLVSIMFSCTDFSVFGGSEILWKTFVSSLFLDENDFSCVKL